MIHLKHYTLLKESFTLYFIPTLQKPSILIPDFINQFYIIILKDAERFMQQNLSSGLRMKF